MILGSLCDSFGDHILNVVDGYRAEEFTAELGEQADRGDGLLHAAPTTAGPVEHCPDQRQAGPLAGESADHLDSAACLAEGALDEVGVPDATVVLGGEPQ